MWSWLQVTTAGRDEEWANSSIAYASVTISRHGRRRRPPRPHPARGALVTRSVQRAPWGLTFADRATLAVEVVVGGEAWVRRTGEPARRVAPGDVILVQDGSPYTLSDAPDSAVQVIVYGRGRCGAPGEPPTAAADNWRLPGPRTYGNAGDVDLPGATVVLRGAYEVEGDVCDRLLGAVPPLAVVPADPVTAPVVDLLAREVARDEPGQDAVLDRLLDLLLVLAVRQWFTRPEAEPPAWYTALFRPARRAGAADAARRPRPAVDGGTDGGGGRCLEGRVRPPLRRPRRRAAPGLSDRAAHGPRRRDARRARAPRRRGGRPGGGYGDGFAFSAAFKRARGVPPSRCARPGRRA